MIEMGVHICIDYNVPPPKSSWNFYNRLSNSSYELEQIQITMKAPL